MLGINFASLEGHNIPDPNNGLAVELEGEAGDDDDDEVESVATPESLKNTSSADLITIKPTTDLLPSFVMDVPHPLILKFISLLTLIDVPQEGGNI